MKKNRFFMYGRILLIIFAVVVLCKPTDAEAAKVKTLELSASKKTLYIGDTYKPKVKVTPAKASKSPIKWKTSNKRIATVNKNGKITAKAKGTATITCYVQGKSNIKAKCKVTVKKLNFTARTKRPSLKDQNYFSLQNIYYQFDRYAPTGIAYEEGRYCAGNCTWYACGRAGEILKKAKKEVNLEIFGPNPYGIWQRNKLTQTYKYGTKPKVGALAVFGLRYGNYHIAVVEKISNGVVYVSESGYKTIEKKPKSSELVFHYGAMDEWNKDREIIGYIYLL